MAQNLIAGALPNQLGAQPDRYINGVLSEGVWEGDHFLVQEQAGPGMSVRAGSGTAGDMAVVTGAAALSGNYIVQNQDAYVGSGNSDLSIGNGDPSDPRIDLIVLRVYDDEMDSSGLTVVQLEVIPGTPASSPSAPAVPDGAVALASVLVGAGESTSITSGDITDLRTQTYLDLPTALPDSGEVHPTNRTPSALATWQDFGTERVVFPDPGVPVTVEAQVSCRFEELNAVGRVQGQLRVDVSLDGGTSWTTGVGSTAELNRSTVDIRNVPLAAFNVVSGTPTGEIRVRAQIQQILQATGDAAFKDGTITAVVMRDPSV